MQLRRSDLRELHYITPIATVPSICLHGILSHDRAQAVSHDSVADPEVQALRAGKVVPNGMFLHKYTNLYIDARNAMMYRRRELHRELCVLRVSTEVLDLPKVVIADRNAAARMVRFGPSPDALAMIDRNLVFADRWNQSTEAKQVRCAEVLVPSLVPPQFLIGAYVSCQPAKLAFEALDLTELRLEATINEHMFYLQKGGTWLGS